ncbi:MAG: adenosylcobalamin-dependent ribonucleoside-diphosphate reductase [Candidatus Saganbacteria bacterium]|nr:adenosylcobalamin-dependent ribonucleoside-diphosphate reductase [Candidatus Saganbacteria bacterium]
MKLSKNAEIIIEKRYLQKDKNGKPAETVSQFFKRVAKTIAAVDKKYDPGSKVSDIEAEFYKAMSEGEFLPNSPALMNAGAEAGQLFACFVLPVEDRLKDIFETLKNTALIQQSGGGVGFNFGRLRPKSSAVKSTRGVSSGPVSFMKVFDAATEVIGQGGRRRGANMGILPVDHPDIMEFISSKQKEKALSNFNLSVAVTDKFMEAAKKGAKYNLIDPRTKKSAGNLNAGDVFSEIARWAWECGDPGIVFIDAINKNNPVKKMGAIEATNPCGEQPLLPYESCCLGSVNLSKVVKNGGPDLKHLKELVRLGVHFLDNLIDANKFPIAEIEKATLANRKIGLGVMGFADMLIKLGIPYDSPKAVALAEKLMKFIREEAQKMSQELAATRGSFPNFKDSAYKSKVKAMRNATVTTIAPTGTISIIAGCSSGIEPIFAVAYVRLLADGQEIVECCPLFEEMMKKRKLYNHEFCKRVLSEGGINEMSSIPEDIKKLFLPAVGISYEWHVAIAAAFQKYTDNAVSKTVNLPSSASKEDVKNVFLSAYKNKCKGITVFRQGCKKEQVLSIKPEDTGRIAVESEFAGGCPVSYCVD